VTLLEKRRTYRRFQLTVDDHLAFRINAVDLKGRFSLTESAISNSTKDIER
jgi:hypothetical protein